MPKLTEAVKRKKAATPAPVKTTKTPTATPRKSPGAWGQDPIITRRLGEVTPTAQAATKTEPKPTAPKTPPAPSRPAARWSVMPYVGAGLAVVGAVAAFMLRGKPGNVQAPTGGSTAGDWETLSGAELLRRYGRV